MELINKATAISVTDVTVIETLQQFSHHIPRLILTVVELINKAAISVTDVTVIETPACFIALATLSLAGNFFSS